ncbi:sulfotransferase family 2 domain-containing protein [Falsihalocynthiibacter sp. SS001]|uniref:sulfotransferase family 2 domain-containing protein n=1 Tax=Falsihalocynthiibacter sp. SS001 TaxID=3349698 RepID=UPI0036D2C85F
MLISEKHKFVYIKTHKTASTSVEGLLEHLCTPEGHKPEHAQSEIYSEYGYVSGRAGEYKSTDLLLPHATAQQIEKVIGSKKFNDYQKIYCVRNPYDKVVSWFWFVMPMTTKTRVENDFDAARTLFRDWLAMRPHLPVDRKYYVLNRKKIDATLIRFESLRDDIISCLEGIGAEVDFDALPEWKTEQRRHNVNHFMDYYDDTSRKIVEKKFSFDFKHFGYKHM